MSVQQEQVVSHGERALQISQADIAARMSDLAATTAALMRSVAELGKLDARLAPLRVQADEFAAEVQRLAAGGNAALTSYRRLVPYRLWKDAAGEDQDLGDLPDALPGLLDALDQDKLDQKLASALAAQLDQLSVSFRLAGRRALQQVLVPPPAT
jgi:hypothetical protein